ncbi:MAG: pyruvate formate-lyase [Candidatus Accumulibacter sp.]|jgi:formate C-acetyltransferase|nr:pyruvate formate-lyase [Accumulibacter sp.]
MYRSDDGAPEKRKPAKNKIRESEAPGNSKHAGHSGAFDASGGISPEVQRARCDAAAKRAKEFLLNAPQKIDTERLSYLLDAYREFDYEPPIVLRARLFEKLLGSKRIYIDDNPIAGTVTGYPAGVYVYPEWDSDWIVKEMNQAMMSHLGKIDISREEKQLMAEAARFFKERSALAKARKLARQLYDWDPRPLLDAGLFTEGANFAKGAGNVDYETFVNKGLAAIIKETQTRLYALKVNTENAAKIDFYRAVLITLGAVVALAHRYADLAEETAASAEDPIHKAELLDIAKACRRVPEYPPRNFREAIQSWWFLHLGIQIEQGGCGSSPGRIGQYLNAYYLIDKAEGKSREDALAWLKCLFVKILEFGYYQGITYSKLLSGHTGHTINVGGIDARGEDATTELDYLILDTQIELRGIQPTITVLYHDKLKEDFLLKAVELERTGLGQPQWMNTQVIVERLLARHAKNGITLEDARNCINMSCVGTGVAGKTAFVSENMTFNLAKCFELALNDGVDPLTRKMVGARTGDPESFADFEALYAAYDAQVRNLFEKIRRYGSIAGKALGDTVPGAFRSAMYGGCLERGKPESAGGADYYLYFVISTAGVDAANSLMAVKHLVFDTKRVSMKRLLDALASNFEGQEEIRLLCLNAPKHGNSIPEADALVRRVYDDALVAFHGVDEGFYGEHKANIEAYSLTIHNYFGLLTGALPTGRKKERPLTDASVSAMPGTDTQGPLALVASAAQALDTVKYGSNHFNMKFHPNTIRGVGGARKLLALIKTYMDLGGSHIQFNIVASDTLKAAKETPEEYRDLTVRVAGFSAYFTRLHEGVQDELIARTELAFS